jgi:hypothetical protein
MIKIFRKENKLTVTINDGIIYDNTVYSMEFDCGNKYYAELLVRHLDSKMDNLIQSIRAEEYNRGWKQGRNRKTPKATFFSPLLKLIHS